MNIEIDWKDATTSSTVDLAWINNLPEVGAPIRGSARYIEFRIEQANSELEQSRARHNDAMVQIKREIESLDKEVSRLWTKDEIQFAKEQSQEATTIVTII